MPDGKDLWAELGPGFTLIDMTADRELQNPFTLSARERAIPLKIISAVDENLVKSYGAEDILVRPDQFIAWAGDGNPAQADAILCKAIGAAKGRF